MSKQSKGNGKNIITMEGGGPSAKHHHHQQELHQRPTIPFRRKDRILLIGEGSDPSSTGRIIARWIIWD
jgi:25S rRNA (uracil2634-N3)-methyltransferase